MLAVRSLVLEPAQDAAIWVKFASLCRKQGRRSLAKKTLLNLMGLSVAGYGGGGGGARVQCVNPAAGAEVALTVFLLESGW